MHPSVARCLGTLALLALASRVDSSVSIPPDSTSPPLRAIDCFYDSGSLENVGDLDCPVTVCETDCDAATNRGLIGFNVSNYTAGRRFVETTVYTDFTVEAADDGAATELDGTLSYDIEWRGFWLLAGVFTGFNEVECAVTLLLWDRTNGGNRVVRQLQLHHIDAEAAGSLEGVDIGAGLDRGQTVNTLTAKVIRGHQYRVGLRLRAQGNAGLVASSYDSGDRIQHGRITRRGSSELRSMLCEAAHHARRPDHPLNPYFFSLLARRGYKMAVVAVAHRLCRILYAMLRDGTDFDVSRLAIEAGRFEHVVVRHYRRKQTTPVPA